MLKLSAQICSLCLIFKMHMFLTLGMVVTGDDTHTSLTSIVRGFLSAQIFPLEQPELTQSVFAG